MKASEKTAAEERGVYDRADLMAQEKSDTESDLKHKKEEESHKKRHRQLLSIQQLMITCVRRCC